MRKFFLLLLTSTLFALPGYTQEVLLEDKAGATSFQGINGRAAIYLGDPYYSFIGLGFTAGAMRHAIKVSPLKAIDATDGRNPIIAQKIQ